MHGFARLVREHCAIRHAGTAFSWTIVLTARTPPDGRGGAG